ncbi:hypothetical protein IQ252_06700 [Tychonema sp. LEGE 07203]|nr:hypothetical protein [Tychonema sp. LEGE 07203]
MGRAGPSEAEGLQPTVNNQQSTVNSQQPTVNNHLTVQPELISENSSEIGNYQPGNSYGTVKISGFFNTIGLLC